jgi:flagellar motility protein MotE (MotC chaperone)
MMRARRWGSKGRRVCGAAALLLAAGCACAPGTLAQDKGWSPVIVSSIGRSTPSEDLPTLSDRHPVVPNGIAPLVPVDSRSLRAAKPTRGIDRPHSVATSAGEGKPAASQASAPKLNPELSKKAAAQAAEAPPAQQYCLNIADAAADARFASQAKALKEMEQEIDKRIVRLEEKTAEYRKWLARRDEFSQKAQENLVGIFARMRADAAAAQFAAMDEETAAALLNKLDARISSGILAEMEPTQAARLAATIAGAAKVTPDRSAKADPDGKKS